MLFIFYILFPVFVGLGALYLFFKGQRDGLGYALLMFLVCSGIMYWSITQSSSSTAAIGFLFIPCFAAACSFFIWVFWRLQGRASRVFKVLGFVSLFASMGICGYGLYSGLQQRQEKLNRYKLAVRIQEQRTRILQNFSHHAGAEAEWIKQEIVSRLETHTHTRTHTDLQLEDEAFIAAALTTNYVDREVLAMISLTENLNTVAAVIKHQNSDTKLLEEIYDRNKDKSQLDYAFALNHNTPAAILEAAYHRSPYIASALAKNTNVAKELLLILSKTNVHANDLDTFASIVRHAHADCDVLNAVIRSLQASEGAVGENQSENNNENRRESQRLAILKDAELKMKSVCPSQ
ncbi:MAG: hypothetical protein JNL11_15835 [Bdellovibrionaceae bacterium]|nr:hypothetical protein [Pseudobdellovibrionaceae bacterium]